MKSTYKEVYDSFWKELIENKDGTLNKDSVARELSDYKFLMDQIPLVYDHVTGGLLSKTNYHAHVIISASDEYFSRLIEQEKVEWEEERLEKTATRKTQAP